MQHVRTVRHQQFEDIIYVPIRSKGLHRQGYRVVGSHYAVARGGFHPLLPPIRWWEPFGQDTWGAWVPSPTIPTSLFRLLLDGY